MSLRPRVIAATLLYCCLTACGAKSGLRVPEAGVVAREFRLIAPWSTSTAHTQQPTFEWIASHNAMGASGQVRVQWCRDRACRSEISSRLTNETSVRPLTPLPSGPVFWRVTNEVGEQSKTWEVFVPRANSGQNSVYGSVLDLNGDGLADVAAGALRAFANRGLDAGVVQVFLGQRDLSQVRLSTLLRGFAGDHLGHAVASAGDVNGDGYGDLLVSAVDADVEDPFNEAPGPGAVMLYYGSAEGLGIDPRPARVFTGTSMREAFGSAIACAGDVNHDGYTDVLVGARLADGANMDVGASGLYLGSADGLQAAPSRTWRGADAMEFFGLALASGADVNGDGLTDFAVGGLFAMPGGMRQAGRALLFLSSSDRMNDAPSTILTGQTAFDAFATSLSPLFDYDGDGYADLFVGARYADPNGLQDAGSVSYFRGTPTGFSTAATSVISGDQPGALFGHAIVRAGDLDGDGVGDLAVSAENGTYQGVLGAGYVQVYLRGQFAADPTHRRGGEAMRDNFGGALAAGADIDGDGFDDLVVGAYHADVGALRDAGRLYIFKGGVGGISRAPSLVIQSQYENGALGYSLAM